MSTTHTHPTSHHRAKPSQWSLVEGTIDSTTSSCTSRSKSSCIIELRDRIRRLEVTQHAHIEAKSSEAAAVDQVITPHDQIRDAALICAYARNFIEEYGTSEEADELERIIAALSRRLAFDV